jgi:hypothetical protein
MRWVMPKNLGTNSRWSSKATKACGRGSGFELSTLNVIVGLLYLYLGGVLDWGHDPMAATRIQQQSK